jgi:hypothetical protein
MATVIKSLEWYEEMKEENGGCCLGCGEDAYGVEPDARNYECEECGDNRVFGCDELLMMGLIE